LKIFDGHFYMRAVIYVTQPSSGVNMPFRMRVYERESIGMALRRFKKLLERTGVQKELRRRRYYEKPCEARRRIKLRKQSTIRRARLD
jgi:small subunit ribosomal protein S21